MQCSYGRRKSLLKRHYGSHGTSYTEHALSLVATHDDPSGSTTCTMMLLKAAALSLSAVAKGCFES